MRLVIADDEALLREGLARVLEDAGFDVVGRCGDAEALLRMVEARQPDVAIIDIRMPPGHGDDGLVAAQEIRRRHPEIGVLVLSHYLDSRYAARLLDEVPPGSDTCSRTASQRSLSWPTPFEESPKATA